MPIPSLYAFYPCTHLDNKIVRADSVSKLSCKNTRLLVHRYCSYQQELKLGFSVSRKEALNFKTEVVISIALRAPRRCFYQSQARLPVYYVNISVFL